MPKSLGRIVQHDPRSKSYAFKAPRTVTYATVQHPSHIGILDQGDLGSCTGNATVGALGCDPFYGHLTGTGVTLDEAEAVRLYSAATELDDDPDHYPPTDTGSSGLAVAKAAQQAGLISGYQHAFSVADALAALQLGPVICGVDWYSSFDEPASSGLVGISRGAYVRGGHEVCADGYDADMGWVWLRNSWGTAYGVQGRFALTVATFTQLLANDGDVTVLVPLTAPAPTPTPTPAVDAALATWWAASKPWALAHHVGTNALAAKAALALATSKGL